MKYGECQRLRFGLNELYQKQQESVRSHQVRHPSCSATSVQTQSASQGRFQLPCAATELQVYGRVQLWGIHHVCMPYQTQE